MTAIATDRRMEHLVKANEIRLARVDLKRRIAAGDLTVAEVLADVPSEAKTWPIGQMLEAQQRWGPERVRKLLARLEIGEMKPVGALTERQRTMLAAPMKERLSAIDMSVLAQLALAYAPMLAADLGAEIGLSSRVATTRLKALQLRGMVAAEPGRRYGWLLMDLGREELEHEALRPLSKMSCLEAA